MFGYIQAVDSPKLSPAFRINSQTFDGSCGFLVNVNTPAGAIAEDGDLIAAFEGYVAETASNPARRMLEEFRRKDPRALVNWNGAYNVCVFNKRDRLVWLTACPFGRRDLYYASENDRLVFGDAVGALLPLLKRRPGLNHEMLTCCFLCGAMYGGATLLAGVHRALPGSLVCWRDGATKELPPDPLPCAYDGLSVASPEDELDGLLRDSVRSLSHVAQRHLVLMSAGVDSPLVAAHVKAATNSLQTITLGLPYPPDESEAAGEIARALGGAHMISRFDPDESEPLAEIDSFVQAMEEPVSTGLGLMVMKLSRQVRGMADGFFCGVSADALFGDPFYEADDADDDSIYHYMYRELLPECVEAVVDINGASPNRIVQHVRSRVTKAEERPIRLPLMLQTGLMIRTAARLARAHGGEALFPFLDSRVVALALRLPAHLRTRDKTLLRSLAARYYDPALQQKRKVPFTAYPIRWLQSLGRLGPIFDLLADRRTRERGIYRSSGLDALTQRFLHQPAEPKWNVVLWQLTVFELFCRRYIDPPAFA